MAAKWGKAMSECCEKRTKKRSDEELRALIHRLNRLEGQIRGIRGMLEKDAYCTDILAQAAAAKSALDGFCRELLACHLRGCVVEDIRAGKDETVEELLDTIRKLIR